MGKKDLFYKLEYTEQLETILEKKSFSVDVKNLLLNMLYKIENSYNDYETVKRMVDTKDNTIKELLKIISECNNIEIIKPTTPKKNSKTKVKFKIEQKNKTIQVEPNEKSLLYALYNLPIESKVYLSEEYSAIRNSLPYVLQEGKNISKAEVIRDFDAWSWNAIHSEMVSVETNLVYQNLQILLGKEFLQSWMKLEKEKMTVEILRQELQKILDEDEVEKFMNLIFKLSIIIYCKKNKKEENRIYEELEVNTLELEKLNDTEEFIKEISSKKVKCRKRIKEIDKIINDSERLKKELQKINSKNIDDEISEEEYKRILKKQRRKVEKEIDNANYMLEPKNFVKIKQEAEKQNRLLIGIKEQEEKDKFLLQIQEYFIKGLKSKVNKVSTKREIIELMYLLRYYKFIPYLNKKYVKDIGKLKRLISETEDLIIEKLIDLKVVNKFSNNIEFDKNLIKKIFDLKLISLENIYIMFDKKESIIATFYDVETIEKVYEMDDKDSKVTKFKKKIKMFI